MFNSRGLSLVETIVALVVGSIIVLAIGGLSGTLMRQRTTTSSSSAAMNLAERQMETLLADPNPNPPAGCTVSQALCGNTTSSGLLHGPTVVNVTATPTAGGEYSISYWVKDNSANSDSPLLRPTAIPAKVKRLTVKVTHTKNAKAGATLVRYVRP